MKRISPLSRRTARTLFFLGATVFALGLGGCARKAQPVAPAVVYPYSAAAQKVFYAGAAGLSEVPPTASVASGSGEDILASRAPNASVISSDGTAIVAAVNGWGLVRIETKADGAASPGGAAYRLVGTPLPAAFTGLTTLGAWPLNGGFLIQLFHDPFSEDPMPASHLTPSLPLPASRLVFFDAKKDSASTLDPLPLGLDPGFELFAFLPSGGRWFAELRKDAAERVDLKFLSLGDPLGDARTSTSREISHADFEAALAPKPLASLQGSAGASLKSALAALGSGPWLIRLRSASGDDRWFLSAGKPDEATSVFAWAEPDSGLTLALRFDGWLASSNAQGRTKLESLAVPAPGAAFVSLTAAGGIAVAAWESGEFPNIAQAGLVVAPLPR